MVAPSAPDSVLTPRLPLAADGSTQRRRHEVLAVCAFNFLRYGKDEKAAVLLRALALLAPEDRRIRRMLAFGCVRTGRHHEALDATTWLLGRELDSAERRDVLLLHSQALLGLGRSDEAHQAFHVYLLEKEGEDERL